MGFEDYEKQVRKPKGSAKRGETTVDALGLQKREKDHAWSKRKGGRNSRGGEGKPDERRRHVF